VKILLVLPPNYSYVVQPNLGLGYIAAAVQNAGHEAVILDWMRDGITMKDFSDMLLAANFDMVGFHMFSQDYDIIKQLSRIVKEINPRIYTIVGGSHPTGDPHSIIEDFPCVDYGFRGEAELGIVQLLKLLSQECAEAQELAKIKGLYWKGRDLESVISAEIENLDLIPFPAWELMRPDTYPMAPHGAFVKQMPCAPIILSRGCPFSCTFCAGANHRYRKRSLDNVMEEIRLLNTNYGVKELLIEDENLILNRKFAQEFCESLLRINKGYTWSCPSGIRLSCVDLELMKLMNRAGCHSVSVGIEFGSQRIFDITKKGLTLKMIREKMQILAKTNIKTTGFFMLGIPGETLAEMEKTIKFMLTLPLDRVQINNFMPLPGTQIYHDLKNSDECGDINYSSFSVHKVAYVSGEVSKQDIKRLQRKGYIRFYFRWKIIKILAEIRSFRHLRYLIKRFWGGLF